METTKVRPYMNPYLAGFLLGMVLLTTIYITGRGLGASGSLKSVVMEAVRTVTPASWNNETFYKEYVQEHPGNPMNSWLVFEIIGLIIGAFYSGLISNRLGFRITKGDHITNKTRLMFAALGGLLFGLGSQFGRGCTSGAALSGMAVLSFGGILTMIAIFGSAYGMAFFVRKLWL